MKRRRRGSSGSSSSAGKRTYKQKSYPIRMGKNLSNPAVLLRMPDPDMPLPPTDIQSYFYQEEVIVQDDEEEEAQEAKKREQAGGGAKPPMRRFRPRPTVRWVLEALDTRLHGASSTVQAKDGSAYFILQVDEAIRETQMVPLKEIILLRQTHNTHQEEAGGLTAAAKEFIEHGKAFDQRAQQWAKRYGKELVDLLGVGNDDDEEDGEGQEGRRKRRHKRWHRTQRVDEDADAGEDDFNPSTKVGTSYQDVFGLMEEGKKGGEREALAVAFEEVDCGYDEIPDGADDGFGAPEYGTETMQPVQQVAAREMEELEPILFDEDSAIEGYSSGSSSEEEEEEEEERKVAVAGGGGKKEAPAAFEEAFAGLMHEEEEDDHYLGDDDDSSESEGEEEGRRKRAAT